MPAARRSVVTLVNDFLQGPDEIVANLGVDIIREMLRRQSRTGREVRPAWWKGEKFMAFRGKIGESTSTCWNFEQSSMGSSGVFGPQHTFIPRGPSS